MSKGFVALKGASRSVSLKFSINALCKFEDLTGESADDLLRKGKFSVNQMRALFQAALFDTEPDITPHEVGQLMDEAGTTRCQDALQAALKLAFPDAFEDDAAGNDQGAVTVD